VPVVDGSITDLTMIVEKETTSAEVNAVIKKACENELKGIVEYSEEELVSSDIIGTKVSGILDSKLTSAMGNLVKVCAWYDNEYGYSCRVVDLTDRMLKM